MKKSVRTALAAAALIALVGGGNQVIVAQTAQKPKAAQQGREPHPVIVSSIRQLEGVKDRLQKAPTDFGGHREAAVDAITHAISELNMALNYDKK